MLNQMIESKNNHNENARKNRFLFAVCAVFTFMLATGWTYSLFAKNFGMGGGELEMAGLVAPVTVTEEAPPKVEPQRKPEKSPMAVTSNKVILKELYDDISSSKIPPKNTVGEKDVINAKQFGLDNVEKGKFNRIPTSGGRQTDPNDSNCGLCDNESRNTDPKKSKDDDFLEKAVVKKNPPTDVEKPKPNKISLGVINGKADFLAQPVYPATARAVRAEGAVNVQISIDEKGNITSATAVSGHPLLRAAAVEAARKSRFSPTYLSKVPVKVTGVIVYNFKL